MKLELFQLKQNIMREKPIIDVFTNDILAARQIHHVLRGITNKDAIVRIHAEGKSLDAWKKLGVEAIPFSLADCFDADGAPDLIMTGASTGDGTIEQGALMYAIAHNIPNVVVSDTWGSALRHIPPSRPNLILVIDDIDRDITRKSGYEGSIITVGDDSGYYVTHTLASIKGGSKVCKNELRNHLLVVGQGLDYTLGLLDIAHKCALLSEGKWKIIPRLIHPKYKDKPEARGIESALRSINPMMVVDYPNLTTDELSMLAPITMSVFSKNLRYAALAGNIGVSVKGRAQREGMKASIGFDTHPLVTGKICSEITEPETLERITINHHRHCTNSERYIFDSALRDNDKKVVSISLLTIATEHMKQTAHASV